MLSSSHAFSLVSGCIKTVGGHSGPIRMMHTLAQLGLETFNHIRAFKSIIMHDTDIGLPSFDHGIDRRVFNGVNQSTTIRELVDLVLQNAVPHNPHITGAVKRDAFGIGEFDRAKGAVNAKIGRDIDDREVEADERVVRDMREAFWLARSKFDRVVPPIKKGGSKKIEKGVSKSGSKSSPRSASGPSKTRRRAPAKVLCHFHAEMDDELIVRRATTIEVIVSREAIGRVTGISSKSGRARVDPQKKFIIQAIPKLNFAVIDQARIEIAPPEVGKPETLYFDVRPTDLGEGEIWITIRQGQISLCSLVLKSRIVKTRSAQSHRVKGNHSMPEEPMVLVKPLHQLRIFEQQNGQQISYLYELQSPDLDILTTYNSEPFATDRQKFVEHLYKQIETRWLSNLSDVEAFSAELRAFGGQLFTDLFPEALQRVLWEHRDEIKSIMVISTEPFIPWEIVHLKEPGKTQLPKETRFLGQMGLVRWLHEAGWPPERLRIRNGRARYIIPQYPDSRYRLPEAEREFEFLQDKFKASAVEPQAKPVRQLLSKPGNFDLLHFACHGVANQDNISNASLMLEGRMERNQYVPAYLSATTVEGYSDLKAKDNRPIVVLNACQTGREGYSLTGIGGFAQAFLKGGAGAFLGTLWSVGDSPARTFTETFYSALLKGSNVSEATITARHEAMQAGDATWLAYAVYGHPYMKIIR